MKPLNLNSFMFDQKTKFQAIPHFSPSLLDRDEKRLIYNLVYLILFPLSSLPATTTTNTTFSSRLLQYLSLPQYHLQTQHTQEAHPQPQRPGCAEVDLADP